MPQIIPIRDLKNTTNISEMAHRVEEPIFVTKNGYGDMVFMSMELYENMARRDYIYRELEASERDVENGDVMDARGAMKELRAKYGL